MGATRTWSGSNLRSLREEKDLSREALGYLTGTSSATIMRYERGSNVPTANTLAALAAVLEAELDAFYENGVAA